MSDQSLLRPSVVLYYFKHSIPLHADDNAITSHIFGTCEMV